MLGGIFKSIITDSRLTLIVQALEICGSLLGSTICLKLSGMYLVFYSVKRSARGRLWNFPCTIYIHKVSRCGSLAATTCCNPAVRGSYPAISLPTVDCQSSDRLSSGVVLHWRESSGGSRGNLIRNGLLVHQKNKEKTKLFINKVTRRIPVKYTR
jgi:hypothetical protein